MSLRIVVLGLSLSSSWGNGHATTWRALLSALAARGHEILFLERDKPWYAAHRDLGVPDFCDLRFYDSVAELESQRATLKAADVVIVGSYVPEGVAVGRMVQRAAGGITAFYDIDTPVTLAKLAAGDTEYLSAELVPGYDLYLSFTGGPTLRRLETVWGARRARALYCSVDTALYRPIDSPRRWDIGYLGTYSADRQPMLERLLLEPARRLPRHRFVIAGPQYPETTGWPDNVERIEHLSPRDHAAFYCSLAWTVNVTRADMKAAGYSPSVRLFEAAACGTPILSDEWPGLDSVFRPGSELIAVQTTDDVIAGLAIHETRRASIAAFARRRVLEAHTSQHRAEQLESHLLDARAGSVGRRRRALV